MASGERWDDQKVESMIGNLLRAGVMVSACVVLAGGVVFLARHGHAAVDYGAFRGEPDRYTTIGGIVRDALSLNGRGIIQLGLLLLIATPVARVAFAILAFAVERDRMYVVVSSIVLAILLYSLLWST